MAFRFPRRLNLGYARPFGRRGNVVALAGLGALLVSPTLASPAQAQIIIGGHSGPAVSVDDGVLERLGPPLTLPQLFLGEHNPGVVKRQVATNRRSTQSAAPSHRRGKRVATRSKHPTSHKTAVAKAAPSHAVAAPVKMASSLNRIIHLIPPSSRVASAAPTPPAETSRETSRPEISHQEVAISAPTKPSVVALAAPAPAPAPKQPTSSDTPPPAIVPPQQTREETPPAPVAPPSQPVVATTPPIAAPAPSVAAAPTPSTTIAPAPPIPTAPPVQMAAATTIGNVASAVKFKQGATDLGGGPQPVLDAIANRLLANETFRVQVV
jgi:hypothetical protein